MVDEEEENDNPEPTARTTVHIKNCLSNYHAVGINDYPSVRRERKKLYGFCESPECLESHVLYRVDGRTRALVCEDSRVFYCPRCKHALFWSNNYHMKG